MDLHEILTKFASGSLSMDEVEKQISIHAIEKIENMAKLDIGRQVRRGLPEIIYAEGKEYRDIVRITLAVVRRNGQVVVSRVRKSELPELVGTLRRKGLSVEVGKNSTTLLARDKKSYRRNNNNNNTTATDNANANAATTNNNNTAGAKIGILAAGTSDIGVAEEARLVAKAMGCGAIVNYDVGVAGMHRLFPALKEMMAENVGAIVVVAGMEGALASVVASMVDIPVVGVPTSIGYGFGANGVAALASMLQSCTLGLAVVNIDNGIGAGAYAASIAKKTRKS